MSNYPLEVYASGFGDPSANGYYLLSQDLSCDGIYLHEPLNGYWIAARSSWYMVINGQTPYSLPAQLCYGDPIGTWVVEMWGTPPVGTVVAIERSSSSSSYSSASSSSSSSRRNFYKDINRGLVSQGHHDLLPFSWVGEKGTTSDLGDNAKINFEVQPSDSPYIDYTAIIERSNGAISPTPTGGVSSVYIPQGITYQHENTFYVDIIAEDKSGIRDTRTHVDSNQGQFEEVEVSFNIPKFTWDNELLYSTNTTTTTSGSGHQVTDANAVSLDFENSVWVGTEQGVIKIIKYKKMSSDTIPSVISSTILTETSNASNSISISDYINHIVFSTDSSDLFISTDNKIYDYGCATYYGGEELYFKKSIDNNESAMAVLYDNNVWSTQAYNGLIDERNKETLAIINDYGEFDAPFKIKKSPYHNLYFIAGTHMLWKLEYGAGVPVYEINGYSIIDFDISERGEICILFKGDSNYILRVIGNDLHKILADKRMTDERLRYCKYCNEGRFYVLAELNTVSYSYASVHYVFDVNSGVLKRNYTSAELATTTTTTTLRAVTSTVQIEAPNGYENLQLGGQYEIKWLSSKSVTDFVRIDVYKGGSFYFRIVDKTPNTGIYKWTIYSDKFEEGNDYQVKIIWLSASNDVGSESTSAKNFSILEDVPVTTTTTTTKIITDYAIGVDYDPEGDIAIFVLRSGLMGMCHVPDLKLHGLLDGQVSLVSCMAFRDTTISKLDMQSKVRVFVGSEMYLSDKWDSGEVETKLTSMLYGGGNNLQPGKKYYVHIQIYSKKYGWGDIQISTFIMPK